ncbi:[FeFe] hydrogenase H-cluster radical SAM maturase HydE [Candidatus Micrarchaeota archaeon]|nr:[FeFe] hydrogenase H-cluster radical SAM maturase HydE [Candidatus Micrarchaeota archaeon]
MCYAIPGRVVRVEDGVAEIDYFGERKRALVDSAEVEAGDFVYAQAGLVVQKISEKQANALLGSWEKVLPELRKKDGELSRRVVGENAWLEGVINQAFEGRPPSAVEAEKLLALGEPGDLNAFYSAANELRRRRLNNACCVHAIIEFSNYCGNDCAYCGIRRSNAALPRYRMTVSEIVEAADYAVNKLGFKALVLQSGEDEHYSTKTLAEIVEKIREKCGAVVFVSVGECGEDAYEAMWEAGARGALIRFETSDSALYAEMHRGQELRERLDCIRFARKQGFLVATGGLIGLPNQTRKSLAQDVLLAKELDAEMFSFGPLIPHSQTPLASCAKPLLDDVLKVLAASRLVEPDSKILVTTALEKLAPDGRRRGFLAGANSFMISVTPAKYVKQYDLYPGKPQHDGIADEIRAAQQLLREIGRAPTDFGV